MPNPTGTEFNQIRVYDIDFADDILLLAKSITTIQTQVKMLEEWCEYFKMEINPNKSALAWRTSGFSPEPVGIMKKGTFYPFKMLGPSASYKYLGFWLNLNLDWTYQFDQLENQYKSLVKAILRKKYLSTDHQIKLINIVAQTTIHYRMQMILFPIKWTQQLDLWTTQQLDHSIGQMSLKDNHLWFLHRNLNSFTIKNIALYTSTKLYQIYSIPASLAYQLHSNQWETTDYSTIQSASPLTWSQWLQQRNSLQSNAQISKILATLNHHLIDTAQLPPQPNQSNNQITCNLTPTFQTLKNA
ncbi:MAG: hypothetical protein KIT69_13765, partial [Propionibacteriaceae bacterium]|nr:hypothetical protein [Propionibacteriaceae bacterium]